MRFTHEVTSDNEHERQRAYFEPFTDAVRDLLDVTIRTEMDEDVIREAQAAIEAVTARLRTRQIDGAYGVRLNADGRSRSWGNPVIGLRNPIAPPLVITRDEQDRCSADFELGAAYEGPPGHVHGGMSALVLDHILGEAASSGLRKPNFTGTITCRYVRATPLGRLRAEAFVDRVEGVKTFARGFIADADGVTVEAEGVFITPAWAREAG
ncbi:MULTISPECIES: PaaI family thioesterase [Mycolicibacterium]|uniref:Acyl-coenzyme A thioesterase THEM4 n=2 Tax=Mycolicibacterium TaxID=1866885 RepID=A0A378TM33_9MYCO|nr:MULTISPECIES: PaaI family thioesterase [Mycolicibacterium]ANW65502.1 thioesterase [Mycobacterium sp. djl-10]BBY89762.1 thioesterase [Mycolicibacterium tokaiense]GFG58875.1 thioesterase [Mycolicibacterium murale]STZ61852.1 thioesterase superfamily protein [Mycolicibacterium tokaiense]